MFSASSRPSFTSTLGGQHSKAWAFRKWICERICAVIPNGTLRRRTSTPCIFLRVKSARLLEKIATEIQALAIDFGVVAEFKAPERQIRPLYRNFILLT